MTQPSLTTTFDTSLIDLATLPGAQRLRNQHQNRPPSSSFNAAASFSTTEPDTEDDNAENADDFANDAPSQAVADVDFATSFAKTPDLSTSESESEDEDGSGEDGAVCHRYSRTPAAPSSALARSQAEFPSTSTPRAGQAESTQTKRPPTTTTTTTSAKHTQQSSPSSSSPSSSPSGDSRRPPAKRRKMANSPSPSPPSGSGVPPPAAPAQASRQDPVGRTGKVSTAVKHMDTTAAYDMWAAVYDEDGNVLQSVDDLELEVLLPVFLERSVKVSEEKGALRVLDLGCGTGRNTAKVAEWSIDREKKQGKEERERLTAEVVGVDSSNGMLEKAKGKLTPLLEKADDTSLTLLNHDPFQNQSTSTLPPPLKSPFQAVISTLVLEHLSLPVYFRTLASLLVTGGFALITNMHPDMGSISQAGFVTKDEEGRTIKVRGKSWAYGIAETIEAARAAGLEVVNLLSDEGEGTGELKAVRERGIDEGLIVSGRVGKRAWKWVGVKVWFGFVVRKVGGEENDKKKA